MRSAGYDILLQGSNGYRINIQLTQPGGEVFLIAKKEDSFAEYFLHGHGDVHGLKVDLGRFGRIALHFARPREHFNGGAKVHLIGKLSFRGEEGFTSVSTNRVEAQIFPNRRPPCSTQPGSARSSAIRSRSEADSSPLLTFLTAEKTTPARAVGLEVVQNPAPKEPGGEAFIVAALRERRGRIGIFRGAYADHLAGALTTTAPGVNPIAGSIAPPLPFAGTATFSGASGSNGSWAGDLSVSFPGAANVALTGTGFSSLLCSGEEETEPFPKCASQATELILPSFNPAEL